MTRKECLEILKNKEHSSYKELHHIYYINYNKAKASFKSIIENMRKERPGIDIVLHHIDSNDQQYELWNTIPMYEDEHRKYHQKSPEMRKKISDSMKGKPARNKGKKHTEEAKEKNRLSHLGKKHTEETKKKMSVTRKGLKQTDEWIQKRVSSRDYKLVSNETRKKISESLKGKKHQNRKPLSDENRKKLSIAAKLRWQKYKDNMVS